MRSKWTKTTLGEICNSQGGSIQTGPFGSQLHTSDYTETGIPVVMPTNIGDCGVVVEGIARIGQTDADRLSQHKLQIGDIVFSRRGDVTKNALIRPHETGWLCGTGCLKVRLGDETKADAQFISYCLRLPEIKDWLIRHAVGATMPNLNTGILSAVPINLPPIITQREIAKILAALDNRIALLRETNATLEAIAQALFKSWFVDFDPVHANAALLPSPCGRGAGGEGRQSTSPHPNPLPQGEGAVLPPEIAALFPDNFEESAVGLMPKGWGIAHVHEVAEVVKGKSYTSKELVDEHHTALVTLKSFERGGGFRLNGFKPYTGSYKPNQVVKSGDLIVAYTDVTQAAELIGKPAIVVGVSEYQTLVASLDVGIIRPNEKSDKQFLYGLFRTESFQSHTFSHTSGTTVLHLSKDGIGSFQFACPPIQVIRAFSQIAEAISSKRQTNIDQIRILTTLSDTLLPRLISGQLRLPDAEAMLEETT